jgi:hypothetical protein
MGHCAMEKEAIKIVDGIACWPTQLSTWLTG